MPADIIPPPPPVMDSVFQKATLTGNPAFDLGVIVGEKVGNRFDITPFKTKLNDIRTSVSQAGTKMKDVFGQIHTTCLGMVGRGKDEKVSSAVYEPVKAVAPQADQDVAKYFKDEQPESSDLEVQAQLTEINPYMDEAGRKALLEKMGDEMRRPVPQDIIDKTSDRVALATAITGGGIWVSSVPLAIAPMLGVPKGSYDPVAFHAAQDRLVWEILAATIGPTFVGTGLVNYNRDIGNKVGTWWENRNAMNQRKQGMKEFLSSELGQPKGGI